MTGGQMSRQPMAEVFGYPINNFGEDATRHRTERLCPFSNKVPNCTKDKATAPLGVCSVYDGDKPDPIITCPVRFREQWVIASDVASFFFPADANWTSLTEVRLSDKNGRPAGNIDLLLVSYDDRGKVLDFGACEVQAVYISGNIRNPFEAYIHDPSANTGLDWSGGLNYPRPDFLSSSRKRLAPQLLFKGSILTAWGKKQSVVLDSAFYETLPQLPTVSRDEADLAWFIYRLDLDTALNRYRLVLDQTVYTSFKPTLDVVTIAEPGDLDEFVSSIQKKLDEKLQAQPDAPTLSDAFSSEDE
jgi:hypothetical protein